MDPEELEDDPDFYLSPTEQRLANNITEAGRNARGTEEIVGVLAAGAAFIFAYQRSRAILKASKEPPKTEASLDSMLSKVIYNSNVRNAVLISTAITTAIVDGSKVDRAPWMEATAKQYTSNLLDITGDTTKRSLLTGYQAQLNRKITARLALNNILRVYGVPSRTMNTLVNIWTNEKGNPRLTSTKGANPILNRIDQLAASAIAERAQAFGNTEAYASENLGQSAEWIAEVKSGQLPLAS